MLFYLYVCEGNYHHDAAAAGNQTNLKTEQTRLEDQKEKFSDEEYVKRYARGKFLLSKEGETLYKLNGQESSNNNEANTDKE